MIGVILNPRAGYVAAHGVDRVRAMILEALPDACIHVLQPEDDIAGCCKEWLAAGASCIAGGGGDGTINAVAANLVGTETPLGVIPVGTLNHFARDVGVGRDVHEALRVLAHGYVLPVDVARVNDRIFLNNSSIGLYAHMVRIRRRYEKRLGKWRALVRAALLVARERRSTYVYISTGEDTERLRTYLLFVGNNQYELNLMHLGKRASLDAGELCCFILEGPNRLQLLPQVFHFLRDTHPDRRLFRSHTVSKLTVHPRGGRYVEVACDGEVFVLEVPLLYRVMPKALKVVVPEPPPAGSREVRSETT